jgi:tetratricopeptide (TPR) repeat protein
VSAYEVRKLDEFDVVPVPGADINWRPVRRTLGIRAFGINAYTGDTGKHVVEEHTEKGLQHEEVYVVLSGRARFTLGEDELDAEPGTLVYLRDPMTKRGAVALEDGTTVLAVGGKPGEAYEPSLWEWSFATSPLRERGDYEGALGLLREGLEQRTPGLEDRPDYAWLHYDVACYQALLGRREDALASLREAVGRQPRIAEQARRDEDFASLQDDAEFLAITREADAVSERS